MSENNLNAKPVTGVRWLYLAVSALGLLFVGVIYAWSILKVPLLESFPWENSQLALSYTLTMCCFCLGSLLAGLLTKKVSTRALLLAAAVLIPAGYVLNARLSGESILAHYLAYDVLVGGGIGIAYNTLLSVGNAWFPDKKGTSSGILMMSFGMSTMVLGKLAARLFDHPAFGWRKTYIGLGLAIAVVLVLCALVLRRPDSSVLLPAPRKKQKKDADSFETRDYTTAETIRRPTFWIFYAYGTFGATVGSVVISFARELSIDLGASVAMATTLVGVLSVCNGLGRILCGLGFDAIGRRRTMLLVSTVTLAAPALMLVALWQDSLVLGIAAIGMTGVSYGCSPTISSAFISSFYGMKDFSLNYSIGNTKLLISSFAATLASSLLASTGSYVMPFVLLLVFAAISFGLNFLIRHP